MTLLWNCRSSVWLWMLDLDIRHQERTWVSDRSCVRKWHRYCTPQSYTSTILLSCLYDTWSSQIQSNRQQRHPSSPPGQARPGQARRVMRGRRAECQDDCQCHYCSGLQGLVDRRISSTYCLSFLRWKKTSTLNPKLTVILGSTRRTVTWKKNLVLFCMDSVHVLAS